MRPRRHVGRCATPPALRASSFARSWISASLYAASVTSHAARARSAASPRAAALHRRHAVDAPRRCGTTKLPLSKSGEPTRTRASRLTKWRLRLLEVVKPRRRDDVVHVDLGDLVARCVRLRRARDLEVGHRAVHLLGDRVDDLVGDRLRRPAGASGAGCARPASRSRSAAGDPERDARGRRSFIVQVALHGSHCLIDGGCEHRRPIGRDERPSRSRASRAAGSAPTPTPAPSRSPRRTRR